jgi:adenine-specific DNA-methyltransferase
MECPGNGLFRIHATTPFSPKNTARHISVDHDYVVAYAKNANIWMPSLLPRTTEANARYDNPDNDPRGPWTSAPVQARNYYSKGTYVVTSPTGKKFPPPTGTYWRTPPERFQELDSDNRIWWGEDGNNVPRIKRFLSEVKQGIVPQTLWLYKDVGHTQEAKKELLDCVQFESTENVLDTVKPTRLIQRMLQIATEPFDNDIVLDFFAGSASTAHAVLKQNQEDCGNRRFVMVQLPEPLPEPESKLKTIADIGKERVRRAILKIRGDGGDQLQLEPQEAPADLGFAVFKLSESNFRQWGTFPPDTEQGEYAGQLELLNDPLKDGWQPENVIFEVLLKEGSSPTSQIERVETPPHANIWRVTDGDKGQYFHICLDDRLGLPTVQALGLNSEDLFICRDVALDDTTAANLALQCRLKAL